MQSFITSNLVTRIDVQFQMYVLSILIKDTTREQTVGKI